MLKKIKGETINYIFEKIEKDNEITYLINLLINGTKINEFFEMQEHNCCIDAPVLYHSYKYFENKKNGSFNGRFFILVCGCGDAGCGGYYKGVLISKNDKEIMLKFDEDWQKEQIILKLSQNEFNKVNLQFYDFVKNLPKSSQSINISCLGSPNSCLNWMNNEFRWQPQEKIENFYENKREKLIEKIKIILRESEKEGIISPTEEILTWYNEDEGMESEEYFSKIAKFLAKRTIMQKSKLLVVKYKKDECKDIKWNYETFLQNFLNSLRRIDVRVKKITLNEKEFEDILLKKGSEKDELLKKYYTKNENNSLHDALERKDLKLSVECYDKKYECIIRNNFNYVDIKPILKICNSILSDYGNNSKFVKLEAEKEVFIFLLRPNQLTAIQKIWNNSKSK